MGRGVEGKSGLYNQALAELMRSGQITEQMLVTGDGGEFVTRVVDYTEQDGKEIIIFQSAKGDTIRGRVVSWENDKIVVLVIFENGQESNIRMTLTPHSDGSTGPKASGKYIVSDKNNGKISFVR